MTTEPKTRKARADSKLESLPRKAELVDGMLCGWSYDQALDWLRSECGLSVSISALTPFYRRNVEPILRERKKFAALSAKTLAKLATETEAFDAAAVAELSEYAFRLIRDPEADQEASRKWMETLIRAQAGRREDRKLALLEAKAAQADQASEIANDGEMTEEEKAARIRQLFRMG